MIQRKKIIIAVHGINTYGKWEMEIAPLISGEGWIYYPLNYGKFSVLRFLIPGQRSRKVEWFRKEYGRIKEKYPNISPSVIAHSFGTFIVSKALEKHPGITLDKLILCGSIVTRLFKWSKIVSRKQATKVRNDFGRKDWVVWLSPLVAWDTGRSGIKGFLSKDERLLDSEYEHYTHSSAFGYEHYMMYWIPFLAEPIAYKGETTAPQEEEEAVSAIDAARWSAITYFHQFVFPVMEGISGKKYQVEGNDGEGDKKFQLQKFYVVIPETPSQASRTAINDYCQEISAKKFTIQNLDRPRELKIVGENKPFDIPTILNSLSYLDHRTDDELREAGVIFGEMLKELIRSPRYSYFSDRVRILGIQDFQKEI